MGWPQTEAGVWADPHHPDCANRFSSLAEVTPEGPIEPHPNHLSSLLQTKVQLLRTLSLPLICLSCRQTRANNGHREKQNTGKPEEQVREDPRDGQVIMSEQVCHDASEYTGFNPPDL